MKKNMLHPSGDAAVVVAVALELAAATTLSAQSPAHIGASGGIKQV